MESKFQTYSFADLLSNIVDNRGKTCPIVELGLPLIATNCVKNDTLFPTLDKVRYVDEDTYENWFRGHPEPEDIIFVCKGAPGNVNWTPSPVNFCIAQDMVAIRANPEIIDSKYLFALLRSPITQRQILNMHVGTMIPHFKKGDFKNLYFDIPTDKAIQKAIGKIYFDFCQKIELNRQMNETLESMAQALFKSWFVDFDPVIDNALAAGNPIPDVFAERAKQRKELKSGKVSFQGSENNHQSLFPSEFEFTEEMGWIPKGWSVGSISDVATENPESWAKKNSPETVLYVDLANTKNGRINHAEFYEYSNAPSRARRVLNIDDTIIGLVRPGNRSFAYVQKEGLTGSTGFAVMRPIKQEYRSFLYLGLTQDDVIDYFAHIADGAAYPAIRPEVVTNLECVIPSNEILELFDSLINPNLNKIGENEKQGNELAKLRDTLLPKLLSGELRIPDAEKLLENV